MNRRSDVIKKKSSRSNRYLQPSRPKNAKGPARGKKSEPSRLASIGKKGFSAAGRALRLLLLTTLTLAGLGLVSVILVGAYLYLSKSDYFAVRKVSITGLERVSREDVLAATGLSGPANILSFDLSEAEASLSVLPWLESAKVSRVMPDAIEIVITEYRPKALVNLGSLYYMDEEGRPFRRLEPGENPDMPIVSGFGEDELLNPGPSTRQGITEVFWLIAALGGRNDEFRLDNISEVNRDAARGLTIYTRRTGIEVKVGFGAYEEKFKRLGRVMANLKVKGRHEGLEYVNIENSPKVVLRHREQRVADAGRAN